MGRFSKPLSFKRFILFIGYINVVTQEGVDQAEIQCREKWENKGIHTDMS